MMNKEVKGILALAVVTALSFGVIAGSRALSADMAGESAGNDAAVKTELDVTGAENINAAYETEDGYLVTARAKGYGGDIVLDVTFDGDGAVITGVSVVEQSETEGVGSKITEADFLDQFKGVQAPVYLPGMNVSSDEKAEADTEAEDAAEESEGLEALKDAVLEDGDYEAKTAEADDNGFYGVVTMTVEDGAITAVNWDCVKEDGTKKSVLSENGEYVMTEDGPTWKEQAEALAEALIENQSLDFLTTDEQGKTDAVSGVSISVGGFISLAEECLAQAAGVETSDVQEDSAATEETGEAQDRAQVDAISGATVSSTAAVTAINNAYEFLQTVK